MTKAGQRILAAAREAMLVAKGVVPAARMHIRGHAYVPEAEVEETERHLCNVLVMLAELHADDRCRAFVDAMEFYNSRHPDVRIEGNAAYTTRLVSEGPIERAVATLGLKPQVIGE